MSVVLSGRWGFANCCAFPVSSFFFFFLNNIFPLQAQESLAALEREIGKVFGDANVIENSDVCTDSVSVSMSSCSGATQISGKVGTLGSEVQQSAAGG